MFNFLNKIRKNENMNNQGKEKAKELIEQHMLKNIPLNGILDNPDGTPVYYPEISSFLEGNGMEKIKQEDVRYLIFFRFLLEEPFKSIMEEEEGHELTPKSKKVIEEAKSLGDDYYSFFERNFSLVKSLCPGRWRILKEIPVIESICKDSLRTFQKKMKDHYQEGIVPNYYDLESLINYDPYEHRLILHKKMDDEEIALIVFMLYHYWTMFLNSPYRLINSTKTFNEVEICLGILYEFPRGLKINDTPYYFIMPHHLLGVNKWLVMNNCINDYGYSRPHVSNGKAEFMHAVSTLILLRPPHKFLPHFDEEKKKIWERQNKEATQIKLGMQKKSLGFCQNEEREEGRKCHREKHN